MSGRARGWHLLTGVVAGFAVVFQLVLVWQGHGVLDEANPPSLDTRIERFFSYFTILSNILVAVTALAGDRDSRVWRALRLDALVGITVTGVVHWFFLRPLLDLHGADFLADKLLHVVVPLLAVFGWVVFGPRNRVGPTDLAPSVIYPAVYMVWTLIHGAITDWYPYPFTDVNEHGYGGVLLNGLGIAALFVLLAAGALLLDRRLQVVAGSR